MNWHFLTIFAESLLYTLLHYEGNPCTARALHTLLTTFGASGHNSQQT